MGSGERMIVRLLGALLALGALAAAAAIEWLMQSYFPRGTVLRLFADASALPKLTMLCSLLALVAVLVLAFVRDGATRIPLLIMALGVPGLGLICAALGLLNISRIEARIGGHVSLAVKAPSYAELLMVIAIAFLVGALAAFIAPQRALAAHPKASVNP
jgi:hypothetical protein